MADIPSSELGAGQTLAVRAQALLAQFGKLPVLMLIAVT